MTGISCMRVICFVLLFVLIGCESKKEVMIRPVSLFTVEEKGQFCEVKFPTIVEAGKEVLLSFKVSGIIEEFSYEIGSFVQKGQLLVAMDNRDYLVGAEAGKEKMLAAENVYRGAKAQADNARKQFSRLESLYKENALAKKKFDEAKAMLEGAIAKEKASYATYREARQGYINKKNQSEDTRLTAPFSGYIKHKFADVGSVVSSGMPVLTFSSIDTKKIQINISQKDMPYFADTSRYVFITGEKEYPLVLQTIGKVKQSLDLVYPVVFYFEKESDLLVGTEGSVHIYYVDVKEHRLLIPAEAVFSFNSLSYVWIFNGTTVAKKEVKIIRPEQDGMLVVEGLSVGDNIVISGVHELYEGQLVRALEKYSETNIGKML